MSDTTTAKNKANYLALLQRRAKADARPLHRAPICLQPELLTDLQEAREALFKAEQQAAMRKAAGTASRARLSEKCPVTAAREALEAAETAVQDVSIVLVLEGRTSDQTLAVVKAASKDVPEGEEADPIHINRALILDSFKWAEDVDRNRLDDIGRDQIEALLPTLTSGEINMVVTARTVASSAPDFPTSRRS